MAVLSGAGRFLPQQRVQQMPDLAQGKGWDVPLGWGSNQDRGNHAMYRSGGFDTYPLK